VRAFVIHSKVVNVIMIKIPCNARSDWLKESALSENRARVDDRKLALKFLLRDFHKLTKIKLDIPCDSNKGNGYELCVYSTYGSRRPLLATVV